MLTVWRRLYGIIVESLFLPRDALYCKARYCDCMSSVRPSVTLVDHDHIGWKSWKLIAQTISPTPSLFVAQRPSTYSQGNKPRRRQTRVGLAENKIFSSFVRRYLENGTCTVFETVIPSNLLGRSTHRHRDEHITIL